jgi:F420H(2)-dependent quinone reductase
MPTPLNIDFPALIKDRVERYLKSGRALTLPLIFGTSGRNYIVFASKGGAPVHPS